ncbi:WXG100 family type VII secretion target [Amycolatopsis sp. FDAARGOS 1241]|uniref:WXG100 family type VII secretion target n=1 Tax=Amycolatopsis sp. FDAARGOS 1241 TaxID=2778070 RepID=UPI00194EF48C|nr:WXG100 family type VII secretion target [Amycolatopsis sp. FDAARGOS 1241]QRP49643.1 WXG100 family type VII secretion target [Amycolatopsis sp. FDAARGOS 1241]
MDGKQIYDNFRNGNTSGLRAAATQVQQLSSAYLERAQSIKDLQDRMAKSWQGDAADAANAGAGPLEKAFANTADPLDMTNASVEMQAGSFEESSHAVVEVPPKPDKPNPWTTGLKAAIPIAGPFMAAHDQNSYQDKLNEYNAANDTNVRVMDQYNGVTTSTKSVLPTQYGTLESDGAAIRLSTPAPSGQVTLPGGGGTTTPGTSTAGTTTDHTAATGVQTTGTATSTPPGTGNHATGNHATTGGHDTSSTGGPHAGGAHDPAGTTTAQSSTGGTDTLPPPGTRVLGGPDQPFGPGRPGGTLFVPDTGATSVPGPAGLVGGSPESSPGRGVAGGRPGGAGEPGGSRGGAGARSGARGPKGVAAEEAAAARGASAGRGGPMGSASGAGRRGEEEEDAEHRRPDYLVEADPDALFGTDQRTIPPVIGE